MQSQPLQRWRLWGDVRILCNLPPQASILIRPCPKLRDLPLRCCSSRAAWPGVYEWYPLKAQHGYFPGFEAYQRRVGNVLQAKGIALSYTVQKNRNSLRESMYPYFALRSSLFIWSCLLSTAWAFELQAPSGKASLMSSPGLMTCESSKVSACLVCFNHINNFSPKGVVDCYSWDARV